MTDSATTGSNAAGGSELVDSGQPSVADDMRGVSGVADILRKAGGVETGERVVPDKQAKAAKPDHDGRASGDTRRQSVDELLADPVEEDDLPLPGVGTIDGLAENAGISAKEIYTHTVPMGDGREPVTIGDLKDQALEFQRREDLNESLDQRQTDFENEMLRARQEFAALVDLLPNGIPQALLAEAKRQHVTSQDEELRQLLAVKPEWRNPEVYQRAQLDILDAIAPYGMGRADLTRVLDHRMGKLLHDFANMSKRVAAANARMKELRDDDPAPAKTRKPKSTSRPEPVVRTPRTARGNSAKVLGVADILRKSQK